MQTPKQEPLAAPSAEIGYRPIASSAVVAFILALLSPLGFANTIFWPIAWVGLVYSLLTSRRLEEARREYAGQLAAKFAVVLTFAIALAAPTHYFTQKYIVCTEASRWSDAFLDRILEHRFGDAFKSALHPLLRVNLEDNVNALVTRNAESYRRFLSHDLWSQFGGKGAEAQVTKFGALDFEYSGGAYEVVLLYRIVIGDRHYRVALRPKGIAASAGEWSGRQWYVQPTTALVELIRPDEPTKKE